MKASTSHIKRLIIVVLCLFAGFSVLIMQFYRIQILEFGKWNEKAQNQHYFTVKEPFRRGTFFSSTFMRKGHPEMVQPLVADVQKYHLHIDPLSIPIEQRNAIGAYLIGILALPSDEREHFLSQFNMKSRNRRLAMWLDPEIRDVILKWWHPFAREKKIASNALFFISDYRRSYPFGKFLGQVLHTIQDHKEEGTMQGVPTGGLEYYFNDLLKGKQGIRKMMRSPRRSFETGVVIEPPLHGADIHLTIDHFLQALCEEEIEKGVLKAKAKGGWAVMMEPHTGAVLALAQYPFFNPPDYRRYFNDKNLTRQTCVKAVTDANEPASVMKPITIAVALLANEELKRQGEEPLFDPEEKVSTKDGRFPGRDRPIKDTRLHGWLNMDMAIQKSSNIYVARLIEKVVNRLGNEWYRNTLIDIFGFGKKTNIELLSESPGLLPKPGRKHPNGALEWSLPTPYSLAMGYNLQANTIQIVRAFCLFANGGYLVNPTLIRKISRKGEGKEEILLDHTAREGNRNAPKVLGQDIVDRVVKSMKYVTKPGGGGWRADIWGYTELGKTGTAKKIVGGQYSSQCYCAAFIGFAPASHPAFVLMVVIDEPDTSYTPGIGHGYYGSVAAAPVFRNIAQRSLEYLGIPPDDPYGYPPSDTRYHPTKADWIKEASVLKEKYEQWNG